MGLDPGCIDQEGAMLNALSAAKTQAIQDEALARLDAAKAGLATADAALISTAAAIVNAGKVRLFLTFA